MTEIYLMSGNEGYKDRALEVADGFLSKRDIAIRGWEPVIEDLGLRNRTLMLVDDNERVGKTYARCLALDCADIEYFPSAFDALNRYPELQPDVVLADVEMSEMSGIEFARQIRAMESAKVAGAEASK